MCKYNDKTISLKHVFRSKILNLVLFIFFSVIKIGVFLHIFPFRYNNSVDLSVVPVLVYPLANIHDLFLSASFKEGGIIGVRSVKINAVTTFGAVDVKTDHLAFGFKQIVVCQGSSKALVNITIVISI